MIRYTVLSVFLICFVSALVKLFIYVRTDKSVELIRPIKEDLFPILSLPVTLCFFLPAALIINNNNDFLIGLGGVFPILFLSTITMWVFLLSLYVLLPYGKLRTRFVLLLLGISFALYLQANWINPKLPELDGRRIEWNTYVLSGLINCIVWILILIIPQLFINRTNDKKKTGIAVRYGSYALIGVQFIVLIMLIVLPKDNVIPNVWFSEEGEFSLGKEDNVIIFVMDSLGATNFESAVSEYPEITEALEDFTYFSNEVAGGSYTDLGIPTLLTGVEYDPEYISYSDYLLDAWSSVDIYRKLADEGYDIRFYTDRRYVTNVSDKVISNVVSGGGDYYIEDKIPFAKQLYRLTGYYALPTALKRYFWMNTTDITKYVTSGDRDQSDNENDVAVGEAAFFNDNLFHEILDDHGIDIGFDKAYRVYHMVGPHEPYTLGIDGYEAKEGISDENDQIAGCFRIVAEYMDHMKEKGIYDSATIIITADHGPPGNENGIQQNSCLLIKQSDTHHDYEKNEAPIHSRNVLSTIADETGLDYMAYGPRVWDIDESSDVERLHTARRASAIGMFPDIPEDTHSERFIIGDDSTDVENIKMTVGSARNRVEYVIGEELDFATDIPSSKGITDRLYYDDKGATASNELYLCFKLDNYSGGPVEFNFTFDKVYNDVQHVRIYTEGERVATINCRQKEAGDVYTIDIPKEYIRDNLLPLRMVFPGAVTPNMIDSSVSDKRVYSIHFNKIWITE